MNHTQFDSLTRSFAQGISRRQTFKILLGSVASVVTNNIFALSDENTLSSTSLTTQVVCESDPNKEVSIPCDQFQYYIDECGVICPSGEIKQGWWGCTTIPDIPPSRTKIISESPQFINFDRRSCVNVIVTWKINFKTKLESNVIKFKATDQTCCPKACGNEVQEILAAVKKHESDHRANINSARDYENRLWNRRLFTACGNNQTEYRGNLWFQVDQEIQVSMDRFQKAARTEPPQARDLNCDKCKTANLGSGDICYHDTCTSRVKCLDGFCPPGYACISITSGIYPVCCDNSTCDCPSGYVLCRDGFCHKGHC